MIGDMKRQRKKVKCYRIAKKEIIDRKGNSKMVAIKDEKLNDVIVDGKNIQRSEKDKSDKIESVMAELPLNCFTGGQINQTGMDTLNNAGLIFANFSNLENLLDF